MVNYPRIMIVEDEGIEALDLENRLTSLKYIVTDIVSTGEEAVKKAEETRPDIILMDIMLHGEIDGVTAAERIHASLDIPIIFITAYADEDTLKRAKLTGPHGYLVKPFKERDLYISIDMALYKHKMEKKLREREKWFSTTLSSIGSGIIATDKNGLITFMNPVAEEMTCWKREEALSKKLEEVFNIIRTDTRKPAENPVAIVLRKGVKVGLANNTTLIAKDETEIPIDDNASPIIDDKGNLIGVVLVFMNISERKKAQKKIEALNEELKQMVSELKIANSELEAYTSFVSHDLRSPLIYLSGFCKLLLEDYADKLDENGRDYLNLMKQGFDKMSKIINGLLNMSKISRQDLTRNQVDLSKLAMSIIGNLKKASPLRKMEVDVEDSLIVSADPILMEIVLSNLLGNAWKFTSKTENARIELGTLRSAPKKNNSDILVDCHGELVEPGQTVYYVRDNGAGFDSKYKGKMFSLFQRLHSDKEFEGSGLGLTIVERIINRHGGKIWAEGEIGKGAVVYFTFSEEQ